MNDWKSPAGGGGRKYRGPNGTAEKVDYSQLPIGGGGSDDDDGGNDDWIQRQIRGHKSQIENQDAHLSEIGQTATRLGSISLEISNELDQQNKMLNNVNADFEEAIGGLDAVTKKTQELIKKSAGRAVKCSAPVLWSHAQPTLSFPSGSGWTGPPTASKGVGAEGGGGMNAPAERHSIPSDMKVSKRRVSFAAARPKHPAIGQLPSCYCFYGHDAPSSLVSPRACPRAR
ncbi:unnamed protein product [Pylaiella littoralis]